MSVRALSERIAEMETEESPAPRNIRQSAYVSLQQTHLPKLDGLGIVEYDPSSKEVQLGPTADQLRAAEDISIYTETVPRYGISWAEYVLGMSILGMLLVGGAVIDVPVIGAIGAPLWAGLVFGAIAVSAAYWIVKSDRSILHRLRD